MPHSESTTAIIAVLRRIPKGKISSYGRVAELAGYPNGARQVVRILHTLSRKEGLPRHRVVNREGCIALKSDDAYEDQKTLLKKEGIGFLPNGKVDLTRFLWNPDIETP